MDTDDNSLNSFQGLIEKQRPMRPSVKSKLTTNRIVGIAMVVLPLVLMVLHFSAETWFLLGLVPFGAVLFYRSMTFLRMEARRESHPSYTKLDPKEVSYVSWNPRSDISEENRFDVSCIEHAYYGRHTVEHMHYYLEKTPETAIMPPVIHFIYDQNLKRRVHSVTFLDEKDAEKWMEFLSSLQVPLKFTAEPTSDQMTEVELLDKLLNDRDQKPFLYKRNVDRQFYNYLDTVDDEFHRAYEEGSLSKEEEEEFLQRVRAYQEKERNASAWMSVGPGWFVFLLQWGVAYYLGLEAEQGKIEAEHWLTPSIYIMGLSLLFFILVKRLRWKQILIYTIGSFINLMVASMVLELLDHTEPTAQMYVSLYGSVLLCSVLFWIPYVLIYPLKARKRD
ncbi:hypothetical protein [Paenibacillus sp. 7516]|uniref:hypothetical protein n=1 Tax=Paenibacillus sp. 7516 TaxID=2022549 RepID=UPI000BA623D8|nr:hypothetical protein [Paenibacillus sp. 7516]PAF29909.1 hypothetical protein CHI14_21510 [Paenibacillus sp. 7516]